MNLTERRINPALGIGVGSIAVLRSKPASSSRQPAFLLLDARLRYANLGPDSRGTDPSQRAFAGGLQQEEDGLVSTDAQGDPGVDAIDIEAYRARIGHTGPLAPTSETLRALHYAHATSIPFENLDVYFKRPLLLDLESLQAKLVARRRGGYCFEHNTLFASVLESIGFAVTRLAARVRMGATAIRSRSHMILSVDLAGEPYLTDVGFGGAGLLYPIRLDQEQPVDQCGWIYRVKDEGATRVLQLKRDAGWLDLYGFTLEPQFPIDYVVANHYTSTHPDSPFVRTLVAQRCGPLARWTLRDRELSEERPGRVESKVLPDDAAVVAALTEIFGIEVAPGTRFW
jgi:N-hydroxyarylamine O-acetyltransferase